MEMKFIKKFEKFGINEKNSPTTVPTRPGTKPGAPPREKPSPPEKPHRPGKIEEPSVVPRPMAKKTSEEDIISRLKEELEPKGITLKDFYKKNKTK